MTTERAATRVRTLLRGVITYNHGNTSVDCLVRDVSSVGARIEVSAAVVLPDEFDLCVPLKAQQYRAHLAWRRNDEVGVSFVGAVAEPNDKADLSRRLEALELKMQRVQLAVSELTARL